MEIKPLNLSTLNCFCCNFFVAKHKCILQINDVVILNICLCDGCVKLDETELKIRFMGKSKSETKAL